MRTRVVAREGLFLWERGWWHGRGYSCGNEGGGTGGTVFVRTRVVAREGAVLVRTRVLVREGLLLWERGWWHGRGCSCENEGGGTGGSVLVRTRVVAREGAVLVRTRVVVREGLFLWERGWWHGRGLFL